MSAMSLNYNTCAEPPPDEAKAKDLLFLRFKVNSGVLVHMKSGINFNTSNKIIGLSKLKL